MEADVDRLDTTAFCVTGHRPCTILGVADLRQDPFTPAKLAPGKPRPQCFSLLFVKVATQPRAALTASVVCDDTRDFLYKRV